MNRVSSTKYVIKLKISAWIESVQVRWFIDCDISLIMYWKGQTFEFFMKGELKVFEELSGVWIWYRPSSVPQRTSSVRQKSLGELVFVLQALRVGKWVFLKNLDLGESGWNLCK